RGAGRRRGVHRPYAGRRRGILCRPRAPADGALAADGAERSAADLTPAARSLQTSAASSVRHSSMDETDSDSPDGLPVLVSIIISSHNYERYLAEAIDSALAQDYPRVEVIVVDDGSTDGSRRIIEQYGDRIVPILKAQGGQCSCVNAGFAASRGEV